MKKKRIVAASAVLAVLISAYLVTSLMLAASSLEVRLGNHIFRTETMKIGIHGVLDGERSEELTFSDPSGEDITLVEPGMTLRGDFCVVNDSTFDVYYRLYFSRLEGGLKDDFPRRMDRLCHLRKGLIEETFRRSQEELTARNGGIA